MILIPNSWGAELREFNDCHAEPGLPNGGQFCTGTARKGLPAGVLTEAPGNYFKMDRQTVMIPMGRLDTIRARPKGIGNAELHMAKAARGEGDRRKPISVVQKGNGRYMVADGNSTVAIARKHDWKYIPAHIGTEPHANHA